MMRPVFIVATLAVVACDVVETYPELLTVRDVQKIEFKNPDTCAECHPDHVSEWRISNHAYSSKDPVFAAMIKVAQAQSEGKVNQFCVNCHAPIAAFMKQVPVYFDDVSRRFTQNVTDLEPDMLEGVTCDVCHSITDIVDTKNARLELSPDGIQRGPIADPQANEAHSSEYDPRFKSSIICSSCHSVVNGKGALIEQTYEEWQFSRFPAENKECQTCHMPRRQGQAAVDGPTRTVHSHLMVGVDVSLLPEDEFPGYHEMRDLVAQLLRTAATIDVSANADEGRLTVRIENLTGHALPSGATADRQVWLETIVTNEAGDVVFESGTLDANGDIRDGLDDHSLEPGTDPQLVYFGQLLLAVPELNKETDEMKRAKIRARVSAGCVGFGRGGIRPDVGAKPVLFPWQATWQCDDLLPPNTIVEPSYQLGELEAGRYTVNVRFLYRTFPPFLLRKLELIGGLDPDVKTRLPYMVIDQATLEFTVE